jgi:hypothetical protein
LLNYALVAFQGVLLAIAWIGEDVSARVVVTVLIVLGNVVKSLPRRALGGPFGVRMTLDHRMVLPREGRWLMDFVLGVDCFFFLSQPL